MKTYYAPWKEEEKVAFLNDYDAHQKEPESEVQPISIYEN